MRLRDLLRVRLSAAAVAYVAFAPLFLLPTALLLPSHPWVMYALPLLPILSALAISFLPGKRRKWGLAAVSLVHAAVGAFVLFPMNPLAILLLVPYLIILLMFTRALVNAPQMVWLPNHLTVNIGLHIAGQIVLRFLSLPHMQNVLSAFFSCFLICCLFLLNRYALINTVGEKTALPKALLSKNRRTLVWIAIPALVIGNLEAFEKLVLAIRDGVNAAIAWLMTFFSSFLSMSESEGGNMGTQSQDMLGGMEEAEPSAFWMLMEKIAVILAYVVLAALVLFFAYVLFKRLKKWLALLVARFKAYSRALSEDYAEQSESLLNLDKAVENIRTKVRAALKRRLRPPDWQTLSPRDKVRAAYQIWLKKEGGIPPSMTAAEALAASGKAAALAATYNKARYSEQPVTQEEAENMRRDMALQK